MKKWIFSLCAGLLPLLAMAQEDLLYERSAQRYQSAWAKLTPRYSKLQFAGSMGMLSVGTGWDYYHGHWETDLLLGFVPKQGPRQAHATFTVKQNYYPWQVQLNDRLSFEPLSCGIYINTLFDSDFWGKQPDKYPDGYYWFSTRIRFHAFLGERITLKLRPEKSWHRSISFFYELSTCDLYLINAIGNSARRPRDYLSLSFGLKLQML